MPFEPNRFRPSAFAVEYRPQTVDGLAFIAVRGAGGRLTWWHQPNDICILRRGKSWGVVVHGDGILAPGGSLRRFRHFEEAVEAAKARLAAPVLTLEANPRIPEIRHGA